MNKDSLNTDYLWLLIIKSLIMENVDLLFNKKQESTPSCFWDCYYNFAFLNTPALYVNVDKFNITMMTIF